MQLSLFSPLQFLFWKNSPYYMMPAFLPNDSDILATTPYERASLPRLQNILPVHSPIASSIPTGSISTQPSAPNPPLSNLNIHPLSFSHPLLSNPSNSYIVSSHLPPKPEPQPIYCFQVTLYMHTVSTSFLLPFTLLHRPLLGGSPLSPEIARSLPIGRLDRLALHFGTVLKACRKR